MIVGHSVIQLHPVLHGGASRDGYEWGWSFWVALGTVLLAGATTIVAFHTSRLAGQTKRLAVETTELAKRTAEDVASQFRPVLVSDNFDPVQGPPVIYDDEAGLLKLRVRNSGRGPALDVQALAQPGSIAPSSWHRGAVPTEANVGLKFERIEQGDDRRIAIELRYRGLGGEMYETDVTINCQGGMPGYPEPIIEDVHVRVAINPGASERAWLLENDSP
jgi:hypothetical protein